MTEEKLDSGTEVLNQVQRFVDQHVSNLKKKDIATLVAEYTEDGFRIEANGTVTKGKDALTAYFTKSLEATHQGMKVEVTPLMAYAIGSVVWASGEIVWRKSDGPPNESAITKRVKFAAAYRRDNQIVKQIRMISFTPVA